TGRRQPGQDRAHGTDRALPLPRTRPRCGRAHPRRPRRVGEDRRRPRGSARGTVGRAGGHADLMTLPTFDLHRASTVEEVTGLFDRYGDDAAVYCGGTELLLLLKLGFASYGHLVDIKPLAELGGISLENDALVVGAAVTHRELERSAVVSEHL